MTVRGKTSQTRVVSEENRRIGLRVAFARHMRNCNQSDLAKAVGITKSQLSSIESGRVPLKLKTGWKICELFNLDPRWLRSGISKEFPFPVNLDEDFSSWLVTIIEANKGSSFCDGMVPMEHAIYDDSPHGEKYREAIAKNNYIPTFPKIKQIKHLSRMATHDKFENVKLDWPSVKERIQKVAASRPGGRTELAKLLGVNIEQVSKWLKSDSEREPGANYTLKMLQWVLEHESKQ